MFSSSGLSDVRASFTTGQLKIWILIRVKQRQSGKFRSEKSKPLKGMAKMNMAKRSFSDRRSGKDRRKILSLRRFRYKGSERRVAHERRSKFERREGWVKIGKWSSVKMQDLKIARYLG